MEEAEEIFFGAPHRGCPERQKERQKASDTPSRQPKRIKRNDCRGIRMLDPAMGNVLEAWVRNFVFRSNAGHGACRERQTHQWIWQGTDTTKEQLQGRDGVKDSAGRSEGRKMRLWCIGEVRGRRTVAGINIGLK